MKYKLLKDCKFDFETECHSFTFVTGGDRLTALDTLGDLIGTLRDLQEYLTEETTYGDCLPSTLKVKGGRSFTAINKKLMSKYTQGETQ